MPQPAVTTVLQHAKPLYWLILALGTVALSAGYSVSTPRSAFTHLSARVDTLSIHDTANSHELDVLLRVKCIESPDQWTLFAVAGLDCSKLVPAATRRALRAP